jgi:triosephosphate isomerase
MLKFYCYNFTAEKTTSQIIGDIKLLCERTKQFEREEDIMLFVFVPAVSLEAVCAEIKDRKLVKISSQSFSVKPVSDELTPETLKALGADMSITGLADRRYYLGETDEMTRDNLETILNMGFKSMLCVGETKEAAENGTSAEVISRQIKTGYSKIPYEAHYRIGTIYRPLWDFDQSYTPDEEYTLSMFKNIREAVREALPGFPIEMPLFYGGMLSAEKLAEYFENETIDGVFWDSKNISAEEFAGLINKIG